MVYHRRVGWGLWVVEVACWWFLACGCWWVCGGLWLAVVGGSAFWREQKGIGRKQSLLICGYSGYGGFDRGICVFGGRSGVLWMEGGFCRGSKEGDIYWIVGMVGFESLEEFVFLMEEVACLWMEGGLPWD